MDREKDIFEQTSKVQNMNYLFDEDAVSMEKTQQIPATRPQRVQQARSARELGQKRPDAAKQTQSADPNRPRRPRPEGAQANTNRPARPQQRPQAADGTSRPASQQPRSAQGQRPRTAQGQRPRPAADAQRPRQARPDAERIRQTDARQPRRVRPEQAAPRNAQPRQVAPQQAANRQPASDRVNRGVQAKAKKRGSKFKKFLLIYGAVLVVILVAGIIVFSSFLKSLEKSQPSNIAAQTTESLSAAKASAFLKEHSDAINCFGEPDDLISQFATSVEGISSLSYIENKDFRADAPSYDITAEGKTVAKVTLAQDGKASFGLAKWKINTIDIASYMDTGSYEFLAPVGTTVSINGVELTDKYLDGQESAPQQLELAAQYVTVPSFLTYKVAGIVGTPEIKATDPNGNELSCTAAGNKYLVGAATTQEFIDSVKPLTEHALEAWGKHFIHMGGNLSAYMLEGSDWYSYIFGGPNMDPIYTAFYEFESISNYTFTEKSVSNFIRYTDDCFTVDVKYQMQIDFANGYMTDENQKLDATWVFITKNNGQDWYLIDCIYK